MFRRGVQSLMGAGVEASRARTHFAAMAHAVRPAVSLQRC
jgi:hypothetical protein